MFGLALLLPFSGFCSPTLYPCFIFLDNHLLLVYVALARAFRCFRFIFSSIVAWRRKDPVHNLSHPGESYQVRQLLSWEQA